MLPWELQETWPNYLPLTIKTTKAKKTTNTIQSFNTTQHNQQSKYSNTLRSCSNTMVNKETKRLSKQIIYTLSFSFQLAQLEMVWLYLHNHPHHNQIPSGNQNQGVDVDPNHCPSRCIPPPNNATSMAPWKQGDLPNALLHHLPLASCSGKSLLFLARSGGEVVK